jgi:hypothetical protein
MLKVFNPFGLELVDTDRQEDEKSESRVALKTTMEEIDTYINSCIVFRLMFISLQDIHWGVGGIAKIVNGQWGSADFSELLVGTIMPIILGGDYRVARIDKTMPRVLKPDGPGSAAGVPDLLMAEVIAPSTWRTASKGDEEDTGFVSVSVKRYKIYDNREHPYELAKRILLKAYKGLNEYLTALPIPGPKYIVVLVENKHDAATITSALREIPEELAFLSNTQERIELRIIIVDTCDEISRMIFHYTPKDAALVRSLMPNDDEDLWPDAFTNLGNIELDSFGIDFGTLEFDWEAIERGFSI